MCEINRSHHWCSVGTEKSQPSGTQGLPSSNCMVDPRVGIFQEPQNTDDRFFFSYINSTFSDCEVRNYITSVGDITEVDVYSQ